MIGWVLVSLALVALGAILINPKIAVVLVWPMVFLYPHLYVQNLQLLPWNIGLDDLFVCLFFLIVLVRRNMLSGVPLRFGLTLKGALAFMVIWTVASFSGWSIEPHMFPIEVVKPVLKWITYLLFAYALVHTIDDAQDVKRAALVYIVTLTLAAVTVVLHQMFPSQMIIFSAEKMAERQGSEVARPMGSLQAANTGCALLGMTVIFTMMFLRLHMSMLKRVLLIACILLLLVGMVATESRSGLLALGATMAAMCVFNRSRLYIAAFGGLMAMSVLFHPELFYDVWDRIRQAYNPEAGGQWGHNAAGRFELWKEFFRQATAQIVVLGQGRAVSIYRAGGHSHNTYISALLVLGSGGTIWAIAFFGTLIARARRLSLSRQEPYHAVGAGVAWAMFAWLVAGFTLDMMLTSTSTYVYLSYAVLIERSYALLQQEQAGAVSAQPWASMPSGWRRGFALPQAGQPGP